VLASSRIEKATLVDQLAETQIGEALVDLEGWGRAGETIVREFEFPNLIAARGFITRVGALAERANHHPEIHNVDNRVRITLSTHEIGGVTERDVSLASEINDHISSATPQERHTVAIAFGVIVVLLLVVGGYLALTYNKLVRLRNRVETA
jgi:4a-hydroxytetrahydrobiopterin dehydratase